MSVVKIASIFSPPGSRTSTVRPGVLPNAPYQTPGIWYGAFGNTPGRTVLVRDPGGEKMLAIFTTDTGSDAETVVARYADRWPIEVAIAGGKQLLGIGQARNRLQKAWNAPCR